MKNRIEYILKNNIKVQWLYKKILSGIFVFLGKFIKTDDYLVLFNGHGWGINDSPKEIYEFMMKDQKYKNYKLVWAVKDIDKYRNQGFDNLVKMDTVKYFYIALKSAYWISCVNIERGLNFKKKKTIYLNTWHGIPLKKIGNSLENRNDFDFSNINYFCYSTEYEKKIYIEAFNLSINSLIKTGLPRNDFLYKNKDTIDLENIKKQLNIPKNKKVILYAPTWRESENRGKNYSLQPPLNVDFWREKLSDDYVLLMRTHAYTNKLIGINFDNFVINVSEANINDLMIVSDILISDYSATIFDFAILEKPIFSFAYDYKSYSDSRGFYIDLKNKLPNGIQNNENELIEKILHIDNSVQTIKTREFKEKYVGNHENATQKCVEIVFKEGEVIREKKYSN